MHILPNISRSKGNQTMKFGQLMECNMRNIFLEKSYIKCDGETSFRPFSEKLKLSISPNQQSKVLLYVSCFYRMASRGLSKYIESKLQTTCFHHILSFFKKQKEVSNQFPFFIFCISLEEKYFFCYILLINQISLPCYLFFVRYWAYAYCNCL